MQEELRFLVDLVGRIPTWAIYVLVSAGAAAENVFPPIPSDTFVIVGGVLADRGILRFGTVFGVAWGGNVAAALFVYGMARRYGRAIFQTGWGQWLLRPHQLQRLSVFYDRYGTASVLFSRFVPVFRVVVPAFAGISGLGVWRTALPLALASAAWYVALLWGGMLASRNLPRLVELVNQVRGGLWLVAGLLSLVVFAWWWRGRDHDSDGSEGGAR